MPKATPRPLSTKPPVPSGGLPLARALERLDGRVDARALELLHHVTRRAPAEAPALWVDRLGPAPGAGAAPLVVIDGDIETPHFVTRLEDLFGARSEHPETRLVVLGAVRCEVFVTVPETVVFLCGGLEARRLACFSAPDSASHVWQVLRAPTIISGCGDGSASLEGGCALDATRVCDFIDITGDDDPMGQLERQGLTVVDSLTELWPQASAALEDSAAWEVVLDHLDAGTLPF
jgi:hypothetical protein